MVIDYTGPKSTCACGHLGDGANSDHAGELAAGHGRCLVDGCSCDKFTWKAFTADFEAALQAQK